MFCVLLPVYRIPYRILVPVYKSVSLNSFRAVHWMFSLMIFFTKNFDVGGSGTSTVLAMVKWHFCCSQSS